MKKTSKLKNMLTRKELAFLMEAHNGLSAKVAEEAGFEGIWGSGLSISAALGVRDDVDFAYFPNVMALATWADYLVVCLRSGSPLAHGFSIWLAAADGLRSAPLRKLPKMLPTPIPAPIMPRVARPAPICFAASASMFTSSPVLMEV